MFIVSRGTKKPVVSSPKKEEVKPVVVPPMVEEPKVEEQPIELKIEYNQLVWILFCMPDPQILRRTDDQSSLLRFHLV